MRRFFYAIDSDHVSSDNTTSQRPALSSFAIGDTISLTDNISHHWCRVLRANIGDQGVLFDGLGGEYTVALDAISKKHASATLLAYDGDDRSAPLVTKIGLVMSRGERMDYAIQKATELGVTAIQLLTSHHGEVNLKPAQVAKKLAHWQQIAIAACEQCGLNRVPLILAPQAIEAFLQTIDDPVDLKDACPSQVTTLACDPYYHTLTKPADLRLQLSVPAADQPMTPAALLSVLKQPTPYVELLIGPEGGLSAEECQAAEQSGFHRWQIGSRVLRTETAPVVALASLHTFIATLKE